MEHHHEKFMLPPSRQPPPKPQISNGTIPKRTRVCFLFCKTHQHLWKYVSRSSL